MATREQTKRIPLFPLVSLLCFAYIFFILSLSRRPSLSPQTFQLKPNLISVPPAPPDSCDHTQGSWIYDPNWTFQRYDNTCKEIFKGWNCISSNKSNARQIVKWRWQPNGCDLPPFDPVWFLETYRDTKIGFVGDSLNRNMFVSLFCTLRRVSSEVKKWRPAGADRGFTFLDYNLTIAYHRTNLLARYSRYNANGSEFESLGFKEGYRVDVDIPEGTWADAPSFHDILIFNTGHWYNANGSEFESLGFKEGYRVDVDIPEGTWADAPSFHDILIFNTGHWWWAPSKFDPVHSPMLFFEKGQPMIPLIPPDIGLDKVLKNMIQFVEKKMRPGGLKFFRTQSPRHFEGGDWNEGGSCLRVQPLLPEQVEELFSLKNNGTNVETRLVNQHIFKVIKGSNFHILDITHMSEFRADAHPSTAGGKKHDDCMHWCLPGVTDSWNDLFIMHLNRIKVRN